MKDERIEQWLRQRGVNTFHLRENVAIDLINAERSQNNNVRDDAIIPGLPERYSLCYREGAAMPPLLGYETRSGIILLDGNNRLAGALLAGVTRLDIYIVDAAADVIAQLVGVNMMNGEPMSADERLNHAVRLVQDGMKQEDAAREMDVAKTAIRRRLHFIAATERAERVGIRNPRSLPPNAAPFYDVSLDSAFAIVCDALRTTRSGAPEKDIRPIAAALKVASSEGDAVRIAEEWRAEVRSLAPSGGAAVLPYAKVMRALGSLESVQYEHDLRVPAVRRGEIASRAEKVADWLLSLVSELR